MVGTVSLPLASFLTADGALRVAASADRVIAWATAQKVRALARAEEAMGEESPRRQENQPVRFGGDEAHALAVAEVSTACALSEGTAARLLHDAADLTTSQWQVLEAVEAGEISEAHARVILDQARSLPAEQAEKFSTVALRRTRTRQGRLRTPAELRACLRRLRECLTPRASRPGRPLPGVSAVCGFPPSRTGCVRSPPASQQRPGWPSSTGSTATHGRLLPGPQGPETCPDRALPPDFSPPPIRARFPVTARSLNSGPMHWSSDFLAEPPGQAPERSAPRSS